MAKGYLAMRAAMQSIIMTERMIRIMAEGLAWRVDWR
jgi:hypothetical protein